MVMEKKRKMKKEKTVGIKKADHAIRKSKKKKNVKIVENVGVLSTLTESDLVTKKKKRETRKDQSVGVEKDGGSKKARKEERDRRSSKKNKKSLGEEDSKNEVSHASSENDDGLKRKKESKEAKKKRKKDQKSSDEAQENEVAVSEDDFYLMSSEDEDCSKGMKKWISEYHKSRPGIQILQQRIDEFITDHEEKLEKERKEREEKIAEEGWTVVTHHKGRKKTTDTETGTTVGSVAQVVVEDKLAQKKSKLVGQDFYRFQKKEAHRNDIMTLQNKFKEDMKRLQQLRAARKFKPY